MIRSGGTETINYQLLAAAGTGNTGFQLITVTGSTSELDLAGEMSFEVAARIYEENPDRSASEVVGGNYSDTVVMTITYS